MDTMEQRPADDDSQVRISISMDAKTRKMIRIAAAYEDMEVGEWATKTLRKAAEERIGGAKAGRI
jgi:hypothetical protein